MLDKFIAAFIIFFGLKYLIKYFPKLQEISPGENKYIKYAFVVCGILFLLFGILLQPSYYFPHNLGVQGDNIGMTYFAVTDENILWVHHPLFPLIPAKLIAWTTKLNISDINDPLYYEKASRMMSLPARVVTSCVLVLLAAFIYRLRKSFYEAVLVFFFFATSYGCWIWALQGNGMGLAISMEIIIFLTLVYWYNSKKQWVLFVVGFLIGIGVALHIALSYMALGLACAVPIVLFLDKRITKNDKFLGLLYFLNSSLALLVLFFLLQFTINDNSDLVQIFHILADTSFQGAYELNISTLITNFYHALLNNFTFIVNFFIDYEINYSEYVNNSIEDTGYLKLMYVLHVIHYALLLALVIAILFNIKTILSGLRNSGYSQLLIISSFSVSLVFLVLFTLRPGASNHYYVLDTVPNLFLIMALLWNIENKQFKTMQNILVIMFIVTGLIYNTYSPASVYKGNNLNDHSYYRLSEIINSTTATGNSIFYTDLDMEFFTNRWMDDYYGKLKYKNITWSNTHNTINADSLVSIIEKDLKGNNNIFIGQQVKEKISGGLNKFKVSEIEQGLWQLGLD